MNIMRHFLQELIVLICIGVSIWLSSKAMFHEGFFRTIDDVTTVRIDHMARELSRGLWLENFPVRLGGELGHRYGYFFYLFYAPLVYYAGALLMIVGEVSHIMATKAVYVFPLIVGPLLFYWAARQKLDRFPAIVGTIFFAHFPYRGFDAYIRGGVGENWAIAFLPGLFAGLFMLEKKHRLGGFVTTIFFALIMVSHNISALLTFALLMCYGVCFLRKESSFWLAVVMGLGLSSSFWLPSMYYLPLIGANSIELNTTYIMRTLLPIWDIIKPDLSYSHGQSFSPAFFYILVSGLVPFFYAKKGEVKAHGLFWFGISFLLYLALSNIFTTLWQITLPITRTLQFSWRVLILVSFTLPLSVAYLIFIIRNPLLKYCLATILVTLSLSFLPTFRPLEYSTFYAYSADDSSQCGTTTFEEYFPNWVKECVNQDQKENMRLLQGGFLEETKNQVIDLEFVYVSDKPNKLMINKYYFPGWQVLVDGQATTIDYESTSNGIIETEVPAGKHQVRVYFNKTWVMWVADLVSLISLAVLITCLTRTFRQRRIK